MPYKFEVYKDENPTLNCTWGAFFLLKLFFDKSLKVYHF